MSEVINDNQLKVVFLAIIGIITLMILGFIAIVEIFRAIKRNLPFFCIRLSHIQIGDNFTFIWSNGIWNENHKNFIKIEKFMQDERFKVKRIWGMFYLLE